MRTRCTRFVAKEMHCREVSAELDYDTVFYGLFVMRVFVLCYCVDLLRRRPDGEVRIWDQRLGASCAGRTRLEKMD